MSSFHCGPSAKGSQGLGVAPSASLHDTFALAHQHSQFGDAYSVRSRSSATTGSGGGWYGESDDPEADYDEGATELYQRIENKDWDGALSRLEIAPIEAKTWVRRQEYTSDKIRWRLLPLHAVCIFRAPLALIEALIEVYPAGCRMKDDQGMLPVHLAGRNGASKGVILTLLSAFPESVHVHDRKGRLPADLVEASNSANKDMVLSSITRFMKEMAITTEAPAVRRASYGVGRGSSGGMMQQFSPQIDPVVGTYGTTHGIPAPGPVPGALMMAPPPNALTFPSSHPATTHSLVSLHTNEVDYEHRTVLFKMVLKKDWQAAETRATSHPDEAATWIVTKGFNGNLRFLPLHKACVLHPPVSLISALLRSFPNAASAKDQDGWLPIHCACFYGADEKIMDTLLQAFPKGAQTKDDEGRLPLHYACLKSATQEVVDVLLASFSKGAMSKDDEGRLPLHHACSKGAAEGIIDSLLKAAPKAAQAKDDQGRLALHHACRKVATERVLRTLLRVYPRAAQIKDDQEKLPIHYACQHGASPLIVNLLLTTYPESINVKNGFGYTPLAEAKAVENPTKMAGVIKVLEKFKLEQDKIKGANGENAELEMAVQKLQDRVDLYELSLKKLSDLGLDIKKNLVKNKDPSVILDRFADKLIDVGKLLAAADPPSDQNGQSSRTAKSKTPVKERPSLSTTPNRLFGRGRSNKNKE